MKLTTLLIFTLLALQSLGQDEKNRAIYARIGVYEVSLGFQNQLNETIGFALELDYRPQFQSSSIHNSQWTSWSPAMEGFRVKPIINYYTVTNTYWSFFPSYRYLRSGTLVYDPGKLGGSNTSDYAVYTQETHEVGLNAIFNKPFKNHPAFEVYYGCGILGKFIERRYSIQGGFNNQIPSDEITHPLYLVPTLYFGLKINFARF